MGTKIQKTLVKAKETKGTWVYASEESDLEPVSRSIYIEKAAVAKLGSPDKITVTIEAATK